MTLLSGVLDAEIALAFVTADLDGRITAFGRGAERMLGLDATAMVGHPARGGVRTRAAGPAGRGGRR